MTVAMRMADTEYVYGLRGQNCLGDMTACVCANDVDLGLVRWLRNPM